VLGGGGLMAAFPLAYGVILLGLYAPIVAMLLALIFRGVAFEFRWRDRRHRAIGMSPSPRLDRGGLRAGRHLGRLLQGIAVDGRVYGGGWWDWLTPFSVAGRRGAGRAATRCSARPG
jgi:cytochrome d ubiquinol oxidase subunit II